MIKDRQGNVIKGIEKQDELLLKLYGTSPGRCALKILVSRFVSNMAGLYMSSPLSKLNISSFIKNNHIDMTQYEDKKYKSYNDFFTRRIKEGKRPIDPDKNKLISPADSKLTYYRIQKETLLQIKNTVYTVKDLLQDETLAKEYENGHCLIFRLAVDDYHRYQYIDDGKIIKTERIPGVLHTVHPVAYDYYPIYKTNTREYTVIDSHHFGKMIQMEVGAMMVGRIVNYDHQIATRGQEKGYFEFGGSTIVVLLKDKTVAIDQDILDNSKENIETKVKYGETIGHKLGV